jgi:hypothetical protein
MVLVDVLVLPSARSPGRAVFAAEGGVSKTVHALKEVEVRESKGIYEWSRDLPTLMQRPRYLIRGIRPTPMRDVRPITARDRCVPPCGPAELDLPREMAWDASQRERSQRKTVLQETSHGLRSAAQRDRWSC